MTLSYINSRTINHVVIYSYTLLYGFNQQLTSHHPIHPVSSPKVPPSYSEEPNGSPPQSRAPHPQ